MSDLFKPIWERKREIEKARDKFQEDGMREYMESIYAPAIKAMAGKRNMQISFDRIKKVQEVMKDYNRDVFYPAVKQLKEDCTALGHYANEKSDRCWSSNVFHWQYYRCLYCHTPLRIWGEGYELKVVDGEIVHDANGDIVRVDGGVIQVGKDEEDEA